MTATPQSVRSALFALAYAADREAADRALTLMADRGATEEQVTEARTEWEQLHARSVTVWGGAA